jgi:ATP-dependent Clp protease ATP-binding subunit ClpA
MAKRKGTETEDGASRLIERDLTALGREGKLGRAHGVDPTVEEVLALLARPGKHPLLAGEAGVGKSAVVQEAARRIAEGRAPQALLGARVVEVSLAGVLARGGAHRSASALDELLELLSRQEGTIVYVRDLPVALGGPLAPVMTRALREDVLRFVFEADPRSAQELLRSDEAVAERLHLLVVTEPSPEQARWIMGKVAEELEQSLELAIEPAACDMALRLASKFLLAQRMPRKAIELLREAAVEAAGAARERLGPEDVLGRFCSATRLPRFVVDDSTLLDLGETERFFGERILGQTDAVSAVLRSVALLKAGLNDPRRPLGVFLFAGPTGVGKTHLAKLLAEFLFGAADRLVRLNMADYSGEGDETIPFGAAWAQTVDGKRGELARLLDGKVFSVLLLDEFEKAHAAVHDRFLQLFDEGQFINAMGETVVCNNTLIVATSNVGAEVYREPPIGFSGSRSAGELISEVDRRIAEAFRPEFLNRFDAVCHFHPLSRVEIRKIAQREVGRVLQREGIRARGLDVEVTPEVVELLVERGYSPHFGARFLQREIEKTLTAALAMEIVRKPLPQGTPVRVVARPGGKVLAIAEPAGPEREATAQLTLPTAGAGSVKKRLDRKSLLAEADGLLRRVGAIGVAAERPSLEARRKELLAVTQAPDFWDDPDRAAEKLRDYRAVDAQLSDLDRLYRGCQAALRRAREAKTEAMLAQAARALEEAARDVQLAEARTAAGARSDVDDALLELQAGGDSPAHLAWVRELAQMYLGWAEKRGYEASMAGEAVEPHRVFIRICGPGVLGYVAGEAGLHRRIEDNSRVAAYVRALEWMAVPEGGPEVEGRELRRRPGSFVERLTCEATSRDEATGRVITVFGAQELAEARHLAALVLAAAPSPGVEARRYFVGRGARVEDPRTGVGTPRIKEVLRGELEIFIAAWISRPPGEALRELGRG